MSHLQLRRRNHCLNHRVREIIQSLLERPLRMPWRLESYRIWSVLYSVQIIRFVLWPHFQSYLWVGPYLLVNTRVFSIALHSIHFGRGYVRTRKDLQPKMTQSMIHQLCSSGKSWDTPLSPPMKMSYESILSDWPSNSPHTEVWPCQSKFEWNQVSLSPWR